MLNVIFKFPNFLEFLTKGIPIFLKVLVTPYIKIIIPGEIISPVFDLINIFIPLKWGISTSKPVNASRRASFDEI